MLIQKVNEADVKAIIVDLIINFKNRNIREKRDFGVVNEDIEVVSYLKKVIINIRNLALDF